MALHIGIGNFAGGMFLAGSMWIFISKICTAIASNIYRSQDEPRYVLGRKHLHSEFFSPNTH